MRNVSQEMKKKILFHFYNYKDNTNRAIAKKFGLKLETVSAIITNDLELKKQYYGS